MTRGFADVDDRSYYRRFDPVEVACKLTRSASEGECSETLPNPSLVQRSPSLALRVSFAVATFQVFAGRIQRFATKPVAVIQECPASRAQPAIGGEAHGANTRSASRQL